jgi:hypothetical protein
MELEDRGHAAMADRYALGAEIGGGEVEWTDDGVIYAGATDFPVITDIGLVGKTGKVAAHTAEVILLTDEECRVTARVEGTQSQGILAGERGGFETRPELRLRFLDPRLKIEPLSEQSPATVDVLRWKTKRGR